MTTAEILYYAERRDQYGNRVFGHQTRGRRLIAEHKKRGGSARFASIDEIANANKKSIAILDTWKVPEYSALRHPFIVSIVDAPFALAHPKSALIINPNFGADTTAQSLFYSRAYPLALALLGPSYFMSEPGSMKVALSLAYQKQTGGIVLVPGGNTEAFWGQVDLDQVTEIGVEHGRLVKVLSGLPPKTFFGNLVTANVVICSASMVATEALLAGTLVLLVHTAIDQIGIFSKLLDIGILPYSPISLMRLLDGDIPKAYEAHNIAAKGLRWDGVGLTLARILGHYMKRRIEIDHKSDS